MLTAFSTALSGLNADTTAVDVIGDNLANLNTTGFKASEVSFQDLVNAELSGTNVQPGSGVAPPKITPVYTQGSIQASQNPYAAAISGNGFFVLTDPATNQQLFTRDGDFQVNANGQLTTITGQLVQGWTATNGVLNTSGPIGNIVVASDQIQAPSATKNFSVGLNLDASDQSGGSSPNFSTPMQVFDSLGNQQDLTVDFQKTGPNAWTYTVSIPNSALANPTGAGSSTVITTGQLAFDSSGNLVTPSASAAPIPIAITGLADGAADQTINWNIYDQTTGASTVTQFANEADAAGIPTQDGSPAGKITKVAIGDDGQITAQLDNGKSVIVAQLAMAGIQNPESLASAGNNSFRATSRTSQPGIGLPETGSRGGIIGGSLESSTVDIATEFTNLIVFQRSYEANARVITTADTLTQDTIQIIPAT